ncbi:hypothetical protein BOX15_Mlig003682g2 [Macrostomum lignano]|uniref:Uncharacterized protein n=1 Tax=Macrostomum lignano TaxID=282301 RepID=A0A267FK49_9PLAT|nr:hypothetical protein BOX15_Mlig003682g2 [Macrostomum lignano]
MALLIATLALVTLFSHYLELDYGDPTKEQFVDDIQGDTNQPCEADVDCFFPYEICNSSKRCFRLFKIPVLYKTAYVGMFGNP